MAQSAGRYYWRFLAALVILVVVGIMAISIMVTRPSFRFDDETEALSCPSMLSSFAGDRYSLYSYGQQVSGIAPEQIDTYLADTRREFTQEELGRAYLRLDVNAALICGDLKASQQGRLVATLGVGTFLLAFLAVPYGSGRRGRRES